MVKKTIAAIELIVDEWNTYEVFVRGTPDRKHRHGLERQIGGMQSEDGQS